MLSTMLVLTLLAEAPTPPGAILAPAVLPAASNALYGVVGAPEVGVGYRQGFGVVEAEGRLLFNLFQLSGLAEVGLKVRLLQQGSVQLGAGAALGVLFNSGSTYFDQANFASVALRPRVQGLVSWEVSPLLSLLGKLDVPWAISVTKLGSDITPQLGAGAEFNLSTHLCLLVLATFGVDAIKDSLGVTQVRPAWSANLGVGWRLF